MMNSKILIQLRYMSSSANHYKILICGGGTGGISVAAKFSQIMSKDKVAIIEPSDTHYYQPMWTLVGAGIKKLPDSSHRMKSVIPPKSKWIKSSVVEFIPQNNKVKLDNGTEIGYDYLIVAIGINIDWDKIKGLQQALEKSKNVCSNYSSKTVVKTRPAMESFKEGNAIFTFPNTPIKCAGAPQKIMYLTDAYLRQNGKRAKANIIFNSALGVIFGVPKYAEALNKICNQRDINLNFNHNLVEVNSDKNEAIFENLQTKEKKTFQYELLHVTPPMSAPKVLAPLADDQTGYVSVDKETLRHTKYPNVFAIGDCSNLPTSKTAAAVAAQNCILAKNLINVMKNKPVKSKYDGYTSCPLVTGFNKCILAEFDYNLQPLETFPVDQSKERTTMYYMKKDIMPLIYWRGLLRGVWNGPGFYRRILHFGLKK